MTIEAEVAYRAVASRDRRFDGVFFTGVRSTGIYCRPSCPARTPMRGNVTFHRTAAAAQAAGFRACRRCRPDATPGSPDWDVNGDVAGRAMRLIADGVVDREGVEGLATRLGYSRRQLDRVLLSELGAGPLALARAQRAQRARTLIESTPWSFADVAHAAGFSSIRQFNDTIREVYAATPSALRGSRARGGARQAHAGEVQLRVPVRTPFAGSALLAFLAARTVRGVEAVSEDEYQRSLRLPHGLAVVSLRLTDVVEPGGTHRVPCRLVLSDVRDLAAAVERCRRLLDADCDPVAVDSALGSHPRLGRSVLARPGLRVPGHVDGFELAMRAILCQQISVSRATALVEQLVDRAGANLPEALATAEVWRGFPTPAAVAELPVEWLRGPRRRAEALRTVADAVAREEVRLDRSTDRSEVRAQLLALPGIGPWTANVVAMRALGDPDVFLGGDVVVRNALRADSADPDAWRPWRSYAVMHLWEEAAARPRRQR